MKYPLNDLNVNKIKTDIKQHCEAFQVLDLRMEDIGTGAGGRKLIESIFWPVEDALKLFESDGAVKISGNNINIINGEYFDIKHDGLNLAVTFSVDKYIVTNLTIMGGLYAELFDIENRLRFFLAEKLRSKYGDNFVNNLARAVRDSIGAEKVKLRLRVVDTRNKELDYANFSDLKKIIENESFFNKVNQVNIVDKLEYLNEVRTLIAHNNLIVNEEVQKIKEYSEVVRRIIS